MRWLSEFSSLGSSLVGQAWTKGGEEPGRLWRTAFCAKNRSLLSGAPFLVRLVLLVEIRRSVAFFGQEPEFKPVVVFVAEVHPVGFFAAAFSRAFAENRHVSAICLLTLMFEFGRHSDILR